MRKVYKFRLNEKNFRNYNFFSVALKNRLNISETDSEIGIINKRKNCETVLLSSLGV